MSYIPIDDLKVIDRAIKNFSKSVSKFLEKKSDEVFHLGTDAFPTLTLDIGNNLNKISEIIKPLINKNTDLDYRKNPFSEEMNELIKCALEIYRQNLTKLKINLKEEYPDITLELKNTEKEIKTIDNILGYSILK